MLVKKVAGRLEARVRPLVPERALPRLVERRVSRALADERQVRTARAELDWLLGGSDLSDRSESMIPTYLKHVKWRGELRWHPALMAAMEVADVDLITAAQREGRGVLLSFMHHAYYEGIFGALARLGVAVRPVATPTMFTPSAPGWMLQQLRVAEMGAPAINAASGKEGLRQALAAGDSIGVATDVPSTTPISFLGRVRRGASGVARLSVECQTPVVVVTSHPTGATDEPGAQLVLHRLSPSDFSGPDELLAAMVDRHEAAVRAWPEAYDQPTKRWGRLEGASEHLADRPRP